MPRFFTAPFVSLLSLATLLVVGPALAQGGNNLDGNASNVLVPTPVFSGSYSAAPIQVKVDHAITLRATVSDVSGSLSNGNVTLVVRDSSNQIIFQRYFTQQSFATGQQRSWARVWIPAAPGTYTYQVGVFDSTWTTAYLWDTPATLTISSNVADAGLHVSGNKLLDGNNNTVILRGVDRSGTEYACIQNWGIFDSTTNVMNDDAQVPLMKNNWHVNAVMIGLNEDCWLNVNTSGISPSYVGQNYINAIVHEVNTLESYGITPIIGLFFSAPGTAQATSQRSMPDDDHSPAFWQSVANAFKSDKKVIFRLKEEPFPAGGADSAAAWQCWSRGDRQYDTSNTLVPVSSNVNCNEGFVTVGMQSLVNIIRGTGATNVIQVPGVDWASSMTHFLDSAYKISDTLNPPQLMADADIYPDSAPCGTVSCYNTYFAPVIAVMPFVAGEVGPENPYGGAPYPTTKVDAFMAWMDSQNPPSGYQAWAWDTWTGLTTDYTTGNPASPWGTDFHSHITALQ